MLRRKAERFAATASRAVSTQSVFECDDRFAGDQLDNVAYLPEQSLGAYLKHCREVFPFLYERLDPTLLGGNSLRRLLSELESVSSHFESEAQGGRGDSYRREQNRNPLFRARGIKKLFDLATTEGRQFCPSDVVLDAIGGNGTLTRAIRLLQPAEQTPTLLTSDASALMVADALAQSLPAIRQTAQFMLLRDDCADGVIFAYGTHHIPPSVRAAAFREAYRVLKRFRKVVIQDFEENTPTARWYSELLDRYTTTGHKFQHFTRDGLRQLVLEAGFSDVQIVEIYDPFVSHAKEPEAARKQLVEHVCSLFGLERLVKAENGERRHWLEIEPILYPYGVFPATNLPDEADVRFEPTVTRTGNGCAAEFPRIALAAVAVKR